MARVERAAAPAEPPTACAVGALVCDVAHLGAVFSALQSSDGDARGEPLARRKAVTDYADPRDGGAPRKAVHLTVGGAGHLVPHDAPSKAFDMIERFVAGAFEERCQPASTA